MCEDQSIREIDKDYRSYDSRHIPATFDSSLSLQAQKAMENDHPHLSEFMEIRVNINHSNQSPSARDNSVNCCQIGHSFDSSKEH